MRAKYRNWCARQADLPLFAHDWWWDAVCGEEDWDVVCAAVEGHEWAMPYHKVRMNLLQRIVQPPWTQYTPVVNMTENRFNEPVGRKPEMNLRAVLEMLPTVPILEINLSPDASARWTLPENAAHLPDRKTIQIQPTDPGELEKNYSKNLKRNLKAAKKAYDVEEYPDADYFFQMVEQTLSEKQGGVPINRDAGVRLANMLHQQNKGTITVARDRSGNIVGGVLVAWDKLQSYYIIGSQRTVRSMPSAHSLLLHRAILKSIESGRTFDFCGSMIPGVMRFFRSFGGKTVFFRSLARYRGVGKLKTVKQRYF